MNENLFHLFPGEPFLDLNLYQCGSEQCAPCYSYGPVARNHFLFHYIISGEGIFHTQNARGEACTWSLGQGEGFMIFPGLIHTYTADAANPWRYIWVEFDGLKAASLIQTSGITPEDPRYRSRDSSGRSRMLEELCQIVQTDANASAALMGHLYLFLDQMIHSSLRKAEAIPTKRRDMYIRQAVSCIEQHYARPDFSLEEVAVSCNLDRSYLGKLFNEKMKRTPHQFLIFYRMSKAADLLLHTDLSIGEISRSVGYTNPLNFSRAFKSVYGISPDNWKKENLS